LYIFIAKIALYKLKFAKMYELLGDIAESDFAYWYRSYRSVVPWSVCQSRSCISTRFLLVGWRFIMMKIQIRIRKPQTCSWNN